MVSYSFRIVLSNPIAVETDLKIFHLTHFTLYIFYTIFFYFVFYRFFILNSPPFVFLSRISNIDRKLKNRVAAQTSRDRKKAKMDEMDYVIKQLTDENNQLQDHYDRLSKENEQLRKRNNELEQDNEELRENWEKLLDANGGNIDQLPFVKCESTSSASSSSSCSSSVSDHWMGCGIINKNGSAVSEYPLPKVSYLKMRKNWRKQNDNW